MTSIHDSKKKHVKKEEADSFVDSFKNEWHLFWDALASDTAADAEDEKKELLPKPEPMTAEQIKAMTKALSAERKKLNQKMEEIRKEIEESATRLETLKLVGASDEETLSRLNELSDQGQSVNEKLNKVSERLRLTRRHEDEIKKASR